MRQTETHDQTDTPMARRKVVVVEDDDSLRIALDRLLHACGFEARAYPSAEAALADTRLGQPDCLVVDVCLPGISGLELVDQLRRKGVGAVVIAMSAQEEGRIRDEVTRRGIERFLPKPFLGSVLVRTIDTALGDFRLGHGAAK